MSRSLYRGVLSVIAGGREETWHKPSGSFPRGSAHGSVFRVSSCGHVGSDDLSSTGVDGGLLFNGHSNSQAYLQSGEDEMASANADVPCIATGWYAARVLLNVAFTSNSSGTFGFRESWCFAYVPGWILLASRKSQCGCESGKIKTAIAGTCPVATTPS